MTRSFRAVAVAVALLLTLPLCLSGGASAQVPPPSVGQQDASSSAGDGAASRENLQALVKTLENPEERQQLISRIETLIAAQQGAPETAEADSWGERAIAALTATTGALGEPLRAVPQLAADVPRWIDDAAGAVADPATRERLLDLALRVAIVLFAGLIADFAARKLLSIPRQRLHHGKSDAFAKRVMLLLGRTVLDLLPLAAFAVATYGALTAVESSRTFDIVAVSWINAYVIVGAVIALARALAAPAAPSLRLVSWSDDTAARVLRWVRRIAGVAVFGYVALEAAALLGMDEGAVEILALLLGLILVAMAVTFIFRTRHPVESWIRARGTGRTTDKEAADSGVMAQIATLWPVLAIAYVLGVFVVWLLDVEDAFAFVARASALSLLILGLVLALLPRLERDPLRDWLTRKVPEAGHPRLGDHLARSTPVISGVLRAVVLALGLVLILQAWNVDVFGWMNRPVGQEFVGSLMNIAVILVIAAIVWQLATLAIEHYLTPRDAAGNVLERSARARTLLPLFRRVVLIVLGVIVSLMILAELGVSIGPLLASAGVIGLAVGFGAQKLVQDVITGAFILFDDAISVGDVVTVAGTGGLVESISIRTIRLRDLGGNLHTIPFSAVETVTNMTKDFSYYLLDVGVAYREDTDQVTEVIKEIVEEMRAEPEFASKILEPLEVLGVDQFADSAVIIKARIKTKPIQQWSVGRAFNRRMKRRFDELGIEIPFPHQTIYFGVDKDGSAPPARIESVDGNAREAESGAPPPGDGGERWGSAQVLSSDEK